MRKLRAFLARFRGLVGITRAEREFAEELESHLQMHTDDGVRAGMGAAEARRRALLKLGGLEATKEMYRDRRGLPLLETAWRDVFFGVRMLRRNPGVTAAVVVTLMLAVGANTAMFSVIDSVLLKPFPYRHPDRLVWIAEYAKQFKLELVLSPDFLEWRRLNRSFEVMAAFMAMDRTLGGVPEPVEIRTVLTSESLGSFFGVTPVLGRDFAREELQPGSGPRVALISHSFYQRYFGRDPSLLGKTLVLNNAPYTIIGVLPPDFRLPLPSLSGPQMEADAVLSLPFDPAQQRQAGPQTIIVQVLGRLKPGVTIAAARADLEAIRAALARRHPDGPKRELHVSSLSSRIVGDARAPLFVLCAAVGFVLLVGCVNVTNLLLARGTARGRETALRVALGAGRVRLIRQLLTESIVLAFAGGTAGLALAFCIIQLLIRTGPIDIPRLKDAALDARVLLFSLIACTLAGILSGILPALAGSGARLGEMLKEGSRTASASRRRQNLHGFLAVSELACALVLLIAAGLTLKSLWLMQSARAVFHPEHVLTSRIEVSTPQLARPMDKTRFLSDLVRQIGALPGVRAAAAWQQGLLKGAIQIGGLPAPSRGNEVTADYLTVTPDYFAAIGVRLLAGRGFGDQDQGTSPGAAVVNETLVRRFFPSFPKGESPVGRKIILVGVLKEQPTIVGVVSDLRWRPDADPVPQIFLPHWQSPFGISNNLLVRASSDPMPLAGVIRKMAGRTPRVNMIGSQTLEERLSTAIAPRRFQAILLVAFATIALLLAVVGIYGVLSYTISQRTHEIGVRMALGARGRDVLRLVLLHGLRLVGAGVAAGVLASWALTRLMRSLLSGVEALDPWTLVAVSFLLIAVTMLAAYLPARRAAHADPLEALRYE